MRVTMHRGSWRRPALLAALFSTLSLSAPARDQDWPSYLGDQARSHFSPLRQIDRGNVAQLEVAWTYRSGDGSAEGRSQIQCNPIVIDGTIYATTPGVKLIALNAG